ITPRTSRAPNPCFPASPKAPPPSRSSQATRRFAPPRRTAFRSSARWPPTARTPCSAWACGDWCGLRLAPSCSPHDSRVNRCRWSGTSPSRSRPRDSRRLQGLQVLDQIGHLRRRQPETEPVVVGAHDVREGGGGSVVEVRSVLPHALERRGPVLLGRAASRV